MNKKIWIPLGYVVLVIATMYVTQLVSMNIINGADQSFDYTYQAVAKINVVNTLISLGVTVYLFVVLRHLFYKYPPLQVLFITPMIIVGLIVITYVSFSQMGHYFGVSVSFYGLSLLGVLIATVLYFVLILNPNTTVQMKYCLIPILILSIIMRVVTMLIPLALQIGLFEVFEEVLMIQASISTVVSYIITILTAMWFYLMLREEEREQQDSTVQQMIGDDAV